MNNSSFKLTLFLPGLLVAATGVGAGDLATAGFAGMKLGTTVLWAIVFGAALKYVLNEGLARWQLATGQTLLEGIFTKLPKPMGWLLLLYFVPWSFFTAKALVVACGVTATAMLPDDVAASRNWVPILAGIHALVIGLLVWRGGFKLFERLMAVGVGIMFVAVIVTAGVLGFSPASVASGLVPSLPSAAETPGGFAWTIALIGGVGGTLTILGYGYWIREHQREGLEQLKTCRLDLAVAYTATGLFGIAMVLIASRLHGIDGKGAALVVGVANELAVAIGPVGRWVFLIGAWAAVVSSVMGVFQVVPLFFRDMVSHAMPQQQASEPASSSNAAWSPNPHLWLAFLVLIPLPFLQERFDVVQKYYAVFGALLMPYLAVVLLLLNRERWVKDKIARHGPITLLGLLVTLGFFVMVAWRKIAATVF